MRRSGFPTLRFTLRTLCGLVLLVGLLSGASAWYVQHYLRPRQEHDRVVNLVEKWGGQCISTRQSPSEQNLIDRVLGLEGGIVR